MEEEGDYPKLQATLEYKLNVTLLYKFSPVGSITIPMQLLLLLQLPFIVEYPILMPTYNIHSSSYLDGKEVGRKESSANFILAFTIQKLNQCIYKLYNCYSIVFIAISVCAWEDECYLFKDKVHVYVML